MNLVVFDLDGTLTRTFAADGECYLQAFIDSFGMRGINDNWAEYEHVTDLGVMQAVFNSVSAGFLTRRKSRDSSTASSHCSSNVAHWPAAHLAKSLAPRHSWRS